MSKGVKRRFRVDALPSGRRLTEWSTPYRVVDALPSGRLGNTWLPVPEIPDSRFIVYAFKPEHGIPDFISFMRARNPVFWPKWCVKNRGFRALIQTTFPARMSIFKSGLSGSGDYEMCNVNKASQCEHPVTFKIDIAHSVVACSPADACMSCSLPKSSCDHLVKWELT
jgi:hypothetical protein